MKSKNPPSTSTPSEPRSALPETTFRSETTTSPTDTPESPKTGRKAALKPDELGPLPT
jgi:hypothetical protein